MSVVQCSVYECSAIQCIYNVCIYAHIVHVVQDSSVEEILEFLDGAVRAGRVLMASAPPLVEELSEGSVQNTIAYEARQIKAIFLKLSSGI